jgi:hypothetical protein
VFRTIRIVALVFALVLVAVGSWQTRRRLAQWDLPVRAVVYPIVGDDSAVSRRYVGGLSVDTFRPIETFLDEEARSYGLEPRYGRPLVFHLAPEVGSLPPPPPIDGNVLSIMAWSLRLRHWAWSVDTYSGLSPDVRLFVIYYDPSTNDTLAHSLGLEKGMIGVVNAFASSAMAGSNNVVIAHELLHTLGATDKYDARTTQPRFPDGYARPDANPRYPQRFAEIMAGRVPVSASESTIPPSLNATVVGEATAREINWLE